MLTGALGSGIIPVKHKLRCCRQLGVTPRQQWSLLHWSSKLWTNRWSPLLLDLSFHENPRGVLLAARSQDEVATDPGEVFASLEQLLDALSNARLNQKNSEELKRMGRVVKDRMSSLRTEVEAKNVELEEVRINLEEMSGELGETCRLLAECQDELGISNATVEALREEMQVTRVREDDNQSILAKYRELEEALALAQDELEGRSFANENTGSGKGIRQLREVVTNQEQVLADLLVSLEEAQSARLAEEQRVIEAEKAGAKQADMVAKLKLKKQELEGLTTDTKNALKNAEEMWQMERGHYESQEIELRDKLIIATKKIDEKTTVIKEVRTALEVLQFQYYQKSHLADTLELRCNSLKAEYDILAGKKRDSIPQSLEAQVHMREMEEQIAVLDSRLHEVCQRDQVWVEKTSSLSQDLETKESQVRELQQMLDGVQRQLCTKSESLNRSEAERRSSMLQAQHMSRQVKDLQAYVVRLEEDLDNRIERMAELSAQVGDRHRLENDSKIAVAKLQGDLETKLVQNDLLSNSKIDWENKFAQLQARLLRQGQDFEEQQNRKESVISELRAQLRDTKSQNSPGAVSEPGRHECDEMSEKNEGVKGDPTRLPAENSQLLSKLLVVEAKLEESQNVQESLKEQLEYAKKSEQNACEELQKVKMGMSNGVVKNGTAQNLSQVPDEDRASTRMAESDAIISELKLQMDSLQDALDGKEISVKELESELAAEKSRAINLSKSLNQDINKLSKDMKEQRDSYVAAASSKTAAEAKVKEMEDLLQERLAELEEIKLSKNQDPVAQQSFFDESESIADLRRIAAGELEATARLLEKAEQVALATRESMKPSRESSPNSSTERERQYQNELEVQVSTLKTLLEKQSLAASEAIERSETLEYEVSELSTKLKRLQKTKQARSDVPHDADLLSEQLSAVLDSKDSADKEIRRLQEQLAPREGSRVDSSNGDTSPQTRSVDVNGFKMRIGALEEENSRLKKIAARRNKVLVQSRRFIQQYLDRAGAPGKEQL